MVKENNTNSLLAQSHNTPLLPPKILHNHCLQVLLGHEDVLREIKNNAYVNFGGGLKRFIMGFVQVVNPTCSVFGSEQIRSVVVIRFNLIRCHLAGSLFPI